MPVDNPFDPSHFDPSTASSEMKAAVAKIEAMAIPGMTRPLTAAEAQLARQAGMGGDMFDFGDPVPERADIRQIPGPAGELTLRCFQPKSGSPRATMLHIHRGAWFAGAADMMDVGLIARPRTPDIPGVGGGDRRCQGGGVSLGVCSA